MKRHYLLSAAFIAALASNAVAQSPNSTTSPTQTPSSTAQPSAGTSSTTPAASPSAGSSSGTQSTAPTTSDTSRSTTDTQQTTQTSNPPSPTTPSNSAAQTSPGGTANQTQQAQPAAPANNAAGNTATPGTGNAGNTNNAAAPSNAPSPNAANTTTQNTNANANLDDQQRTRVSESFSRLNVRPITNVNFSVSIGTVVPRDVRLETIPTEIVSIVPQYRGYSYFAVRDEIVIVEPSTQKIVTILPRSGASSAQAPVQTERRTVSTETRSKSKFSDSDREVVRKHVKARSERDRDRRTVGSTASTTVRVGERVPDAVEIHTFSDDDYRAAPTLRPYRYIELQNRTYIVDPGERRIIEEID